MPDQSDNAVPATADRRAPFCYQTHAALDAIREHFAGPKLSTALGTYLTLTETANREGGHQARSGFQATRADVAAAAGISVDTLDRYVAEFVKIGVLEVERRTVGKTNLPNLWVLIDVPAADAPQGPRECGQGGRVGAAVRARGSSPEPKKRRGKKTPSPGEAPAPDAADPDRPPSIAYVDGRNLALDTLADVCGIDPDSPRYGQAVAALNGTRGQVGIRHLFWREAYRWADEHGQLERLVTLYTDGEAFTLALERGIRRKAALYREQLRGATMSPTALRDWWLDLERQGRDAAGGLSAEEIEGLGG